MHYLRLSAVLLALGASCGDDEPHSKPDAGHMKPDSGHTKPDASEDCPASGVPAVAGCPCAPHEGAYCCGVGRGVLCEKEQVWIMFYDSPCHPMDEDAGPPIECR